MKEDLISVIVPIYKVEKYLTKCVDSILKQTYANIEVILVDDGSPDNCGRIADEYAGKDSRVRVIHKENGGLSSARNAGADIAKGEYIGFVDSDDFIHPAMYEKLYTAVKASDSDMAVCNYVYVNEDGTMCDNRGLFGKIPTGVLSREEAFSGSLSPQAVLSPVTWNKLYRKTLLQAVRFPEGKVHEDIFTAHHFYGLCDKIACIPDVLYYYLQRKGSITAQFEMKNFDFIDALLDRYLFCIKNGYKTSAAKTSTIILHVLCTSIRKIRNGKMAVRWLGLMAKYCFLIIGKPEMCLYTAADTVRYVRRYFAWLFVKSAFGRTAKLEKRVILMGTPSHGNLGDHAIAYAETKIIGKSGFAKKDIVEISERVYRKYYQSIQQFIKKEDLILIHGGGYLGTLWPAMDDMEADIIFRYREHKIIAFPNTCYYGEDSGPRLTRNRDIYAAASKLTLSFRDKASYDFARASFPNTRCVYVPDIVLSVRDAKGRKKRKGVLLCFRKDHEKVISSRVIYDIKKHLSDKGLSYAATDTVMRRGISVCRRNSSLHRKWSEFGSAGLVITDRLHGMIFAAITGTPCIAVDNISKKVSGVYTWIKNLPYIIFLENAMDIVEYIPKMYSESGFVYDFDYPHFFEEEICHGKSEKLF